MKIKLYFGMENAIKKSGIGRAFYHQKKALTLNNIEFTTDKNDLDYDILHINTIYPDSISMIKQARENNKKIIYHAHSTEEDFKKVVQLLIPIKEFVEEKHKNKMYDDWNEYEHNLHWLSESKKNFLYNNKLYVYILKDRNKIIGINFVSLGENIIKKLDILISGNFEEAVRKMSN